MRRSQWTVLSKDLYGHTEKRYGKHGFQLPVNYILYYTVYYHNAGIILHCGTAHQLNTYMGGLAQIIKTEICNNLLLFCLANPVQLY